MIGERDQRRALATERDVGAPEVVDDRDAERDRDARRVADLQRRMLRREMGDRLAVQGDARRLPADRRDDLAGQRGVRVAELGVQDRDVVRRQRRARSGREDPVPQAVRMVTRDVGEERDPRSGTLAELDRRRVHAVGRRAGHDPDRDHAAASCTAMRKRYIASSFARPKYTRFVRRTTVRSARGSIQSDVPVNPVWP